MAPPRHSKAIVVAAGILASRTLGLVRDAIALFFFGIGAHSDILQAAFRAPNVLVNLLGEGTMSAAFIPVYSRLLAEGREREAGRFAGSIFGLLVALVSALVLLGVLLARPLIGILLFGWAGDAARVAAGELAVNRLELTVQAVRIVFPMSGMIVLSAWTLGVLNSHRRFFLPYFAPVLWNVAVIGGFLVGAAAFAGAEAGSVETLNRLLFAAFVGGLIGGLLQFAVQLPSALRSMKGFRVSLSTKVEGVRTAVKAFGPAVAGRGIAQLSSWVDLLLASLLAAGALAALRSALILYMLPVSLFGLSVAAAELPELSRAGKTAMAPFLDRLGRSIRQSMFLTVPTAVGYVAFGFPIVGALFRRGEFALADTVLVYAVLGTYSVGLVATTLSRLLQNAYWAMGDTATPARIAGLRLVVSAGVAVPLMLWLDRWAVGDVVALPAEAGRALFLGGAGLAVGSAVASWVELWRLQALLRRTLAEFRVPWAALGWGFGLATAAAVPAALVWWLLPALPSVATAPAVVGCYACVYLGAAHRTGRPELAFWVGRFLRRPSGDGRR